MLCFACQCELETAKRKYFGKYFCNYCYQKYFIKKTCFTCEKQKRIYKSEQVCQSCLTKIMPCIHCSKTGVKIGLILDAGIVCNSCAYHFRTLKICDLCGQKKRNVHIYSLIDERKKYCYQCVKFKFHEKCTACKNKELIYYCDLQRQPYCKRCTLIEKTCQICHQQIPAGKRANKCNSCSYKILLNSRTKKALHGLEPHVMNLFECLFNHLYDHNGVENTAKVIPYLHPVILQINNYFLQS